MSSASPWSLGLGQPYLDGDNWEEPLMLPFDSYREVLSEHARGHHLVWSAWIVAAALAVLVVVLA
jgi:hypothetical protein